MTLLPEDRRADGRGRMRRGAGGAVAFVAYLLRRFNSDGCFAASGALSYTALVSLVPLAAIALGSLSVFPIFRQVHDELLALIFRNFVPSIGEQAAWWFRAFTNSAGQTTAIGVIGIAATGVLLLVTVEDQLNVIWRITAPRPWGQRVVAYWTLITLGPLLVGLSLSLSTYFEIAARHAGFGQQAFQWIESGWLHGLARAVPALLEFVALSLLYWLIPNCAVRWRDAALGALIATVAIEILKIGFTIYVGAMSYYQTVYGTLATIPIFLLWMYISWMAVLLGAETAAALPHWRIDRRLGAAAPGGVRLGLGLALIAALARAQRSGAVLTTASLAAELGVATTIIDEHMKPLAAAGFTAHTQGGSWVLAWNPENATLGDLYAALNLPFAEADWPDPVTAPWQQQVTAAIARIIAAQAAAMQMTIASLLGELREDGAGARQRRRRTQSVAEQVGSR
ncbi:MAG: YihY family inner membrane protein [Stellaceae bacterium]